MTDRIIKVLEQGRLAVRGFSTERGKVIVRKDQDETIPVTIDWSAWLGSDAISSVSNSTHGPGIGTPTNTTTTASLQISGNSGHIEHRITTAAGAVKELLIVVNSEQAERRYPSC